jgi:hypothetical protein
MLAGNKHRTACRLASVVGNGEPIVAKTSVALNDGKHTFAARAGDHIANSGPALSVGRAPLRTGDYRSAMVRFVSDDYDRFQVASVINNKEANFTIGL